MSNNLSIAPDRIAALILRVRALMAREETVVPDPGGNPSDDERPSVLQECDDDLTRGELLREIDALDVDSQAELVALMWLGRGDAGPQDWESMVEMALERRETATGAYLLGHPLLAEYWASALDDLGYGSVTKDFRLHEKKG